ncbi:hypothetical protein ACOMHN_058682 [Nucella lapillus]
MIPVPYSYGYMPKPYRSDGRGYCSSDEETDDAEPLDHDYNLPQVKGKKVVNRGKWTKEEDEKLRKVVEAKGLHDWKAVSSYFQDRTDIQCQHRWHKVLNPDLIKGPWTKELGWPLRWSLTGLPDNLLDHGNEFGGLSSLELMEGVDMTTGVTPIKYLYGDSAASGDLRYEGTGSLEKVSLPHNGHLSMASSLASKLSSPPSILRKSQRRKHKPFRRIREDPLLMSAHDEDDEDMEEEQDQDLEPGEDQEEEDQEEEDPMATSAHSPTPVTPTGTPIKNLPFSPSQFLNSPDAAYGSGKLTSTPVTSFVPTSTATHASCSLPSTHILGDRRDGSSLSPAWLCHRHGGKFTTPVTKGPYLETSPRTPTPFKHALAEVERRAKAKEWSPGELNGLGEVLKDCETGYEADMSSGVTPAMHTRHSKRKPNKEVHCLPSFFGGFLFY